MVRPRRGRIFFPGICHPVTQRLQTDVHRFLQLQYAIKSPDTLLCCFNNPGKKKPEPLIDIIMGTDLYQIIVI